MANTFCSLNIHCILSTKERAPMSNPELRERPWPLMGGIAKQNGITRRCIGGAADHAIFLAEANLSYLRRCANTESCVLYFYNATKNHRWQWCSVAACGNRHRVAEFRRRQREVQGSGRSWRIVTAFCDFKLSSSASGARC
jgi:CGNR zinc finger